MKPLLERIQKGELDPSFVVTHRLPLEDAPCAYKMFRDKQDECIKVVLKPQGLPLSTVVAGNGASARV
jgi:threonine dehydrogenase-like Zn-dependent dehydrogenase